MELTVKGNEKGSRLDKFLQPYLPNLSRGRVQALIRSGQVRVNQAQKDPDYRVKAGDCITVMESALQPTISEITVKPDSTIPCEILYQDEDIAVVNKPAGVPTHPGPGHWNDTLVSALLARLDTLSSYGAPLRPGIVHRLDKDTTGLLVVAKTDSAYLTLVKMLKAREVHRRYLALCWGNIYERGRKGNEFYEVRGEEGKIWLALGRHTTERKKISSHTRSARPAMTHFRILKRFRIKSESKRGSPVEWTLVEATLDTGRTHQIRVHFKEIGHPLVGDPLYSSRKLLKPLPSLEPTLFRLITALPGQFLIAHRLEFSHPVTGAPMRFQIPLPPPYQSLLDHLARG